MKIVSLMPYCPLPVNTGARSVFAKHIDILQRFEQRVVISARHRPVGFGWSNAAVKSLQENGIEIRFFPRNVTPLAVLGMSYAVICKLLKLERAFGHSNPYHRYAFPAKWFYEQTQGADLAEIHYSYYAHLPCSCPKAVIVHDLWSQIMWEGVDRETAELKQAELVVTVSSDDRDRLVGRGVQNVIWSPPIVESVRFEDSSRVGMVGSGNRFNREGLTWLINGTKGCEFTPVHVYGELGLGLAVNGFISHGDYTGWSAPYKDCGIIAMTTSQGTGIQIKAVEALASGRAIVARKGAMRGLPHGEKGWIEVSDPVEMIETIKDLAKNTRKRKAAMERAAVYYKAYLDRDTIKENLVNSYLALTS